MEQKLGIRLKEYKHGRISITSNISLLDDMKRWAMSHAADFRDPAAIEFLAVLDKYNRKEKESQAFRIFKSIKSHKRKPPLTIKEKHIIKGSKYEGYFRSIGWF